MKIAPDVLSVLARSDVSRTELVLPGQLDRKLYVAVDKVLQACGAKWKRSAKAHVFATPDADDRLAVILATGEVTTAREIGFFATPEPFASDLVRRAGVRHGHRVLEPSAGTGNLVRAIQEAGGSVTAVEYDLDRRVTLTRDVLKGSDELADERDFLYFWPRGGKRAKLFDRVVMNPPFTRVGGGDHLDHVRHAHELLVKGGRLVSVLPKSVEFREDERYRLFRAWLTGQKGTIEALPDDAFAPSGTRVRTVVISVEKA